MVSGTYDSWESCHNVAVLNEKSLHHYNFPVIILSGVIEESFKLLDKLSVNGKEIATGLSKDDTVDINSYELEQPSIESRRKKCEKRLDLVTEIVNELSEDIE